MSTIATGKIKINTINPPTIPDWVTEWDNNKTLISGSYVITPELFAGIKNANNTISGALIGKVEEKYGLYGFKNSQKIFFINNDGGHIGGWDITESGIVSEDGFLQLLSNGSIISKSGFADINWGLYSDGSAMFAKGNVLFNPDGSASLANGNILFDADGSAKFVGEIQAKTGVIGGWNIDAKRLYSTAICFDNKSQYIALANITSSNNTTNYIDAMKNSGGVAMFYNSASDYGLVGYSMLEDKAIHKTFSIGYVNKIAGWSFDDDSWFTGTKNNKLGKYTDESGYITLGSNGLRGSTWYIDANGCISLNSGLIYISGESSKISGWSFDEDAIYSGFKCIEYGEFAPDGSITVSPSGLRSSGWRLEQDGSGSLAGGDISWNNEDGISVVADRFKFSTGECISEMLDGLKDTVDTVSSQMDKSFMIWNSGTETVPTLLNEPASNWKDDGSRREHVDDYYLTSSGIVYQFKEDDGVFYWKITTDKYLIDAINTAKERCKVFVYQPTKSEEYTVGDMWVTATYKDSNVEYNNDSLVCIKNKAAGEDFSITHWKLSGGVGSSEFSTTIEQTNKLIALKASQTDFNALGVKVAANTSSITQTNNSITALTKKISFDSSGKITNISTSGLVTTSTFAGLFSQNVDSNGLVKSAQISAFITADEAGDLISKAVIRADQINLTGAVTFAMFNSALQTTINSKANSSDLTADKISGLGTLAKLNSVGMDNLATVIQNNINSISGKATAADISTAISNLGLGNISKLNEIGYSNLATALKNSIDAIGGKIDSSYLSNNGYINNLVLALTNQVAIAGGFIKASMIDVDNLYVKHLSSADGTIAGFKISGNALTNDGFNNDAYIVMRNDNNDCFAGIGGNVLPASTGNRAVARFQNHYDGGTAKDFWQTSYGANYSLMTSAKGARYNVALSIGAGFVEGVALRSDIITSNTTISRYCNVAITYSNSSALTITFPTMSRSDDGHVLIICNQGAYGATINAGSNYTVESGSTLRSSYISSPSGDFRTMYMDKGKTRRKFIYSHYFQITVSNVTYTGCWIEL